MNSINTPNNPSPAANNAAPPAYAKSNITFALDDLIALRTEHDAWFNGAYKASNAELHRLLAKSFGSFLRMTGQRSQINSFNTECAARGYTFKTTTSLIYRIVKYVFAADNKRVSRYAKVVAIAHAEQVDPMDLHVWIATKGGIEEIQAQATGRAIKKLQQKQQLIDNNATGTAAAQNAQAQQTFYVPGFTISDTASPFVAVLARVNDAGVLELIAPIADKHAVNAVLTAYGATVSSSTAANAQVATINAQNAATVAALNS